PPERKFRRLQNPAYVGIAFFLNIFYGIIGQSGRMAKIAVLSDIHSNLEALQAVLEVCREHEVEKYVCLGDIVGYNANPIECLEIVRELNPLCMVKGNHDEYASNNDEAMEGFNPHARKAVLWTKEQL